MLQTMKEMLQGKQVKAMGSGDGTEIQADSRGDFGRVPARANRGVMLFQL